MIPYFSYTQIQLGPLTLYSWGLFLGLAFLIGSGLTLKEAGQKGIDQKKIFWLIIFIFLGGLLGSRLAYLCQFPAYYLSHPLEIFQVWAGGLMFYGGLLGALIVIKGMPFLLKGLPLRITSLAKGKGVSERATLKECSKKGVPLGTLDILAPAVALGIFIGRIGCSLINDHQGAITNLPWAILWPDGILRHPVAEYLALNGLIMFLVLWFLRTRLKKPGQLSIIFLLWYSISRFLLDFTRATDTSLADPRYWSLAVSQWISLFILIGLAIFLIRKTYIKRAIIK